ncbi:MAG: DUF2184 domain-containing protein, partial [Cyanobacteria bacterium REEB65]|nr:DUF2184 domain-containing protein [Cyanobacteria bacterium REEB65]
GTDEGKKRYQRMKFDYNLALDAHPHLKMAADAQPGLATSANAGVLLSSVSVIDPEVVNVIFTPMRAAKILGGEAQKGSWIDQIAYFPMAESTGQVASYNDYSSQGFVDANASWNYRQPYTWQAFKRYGEQTLERWGAAGLNYASELDKSLALKFAKTSNASYFNGVSGLVNYGLLNDPSLSAALTPLTKANTTDGVRWTYATAIEIFNDVKYLYQGLVTQMGGNVEMTDEMVLAISTTMQPYLITTNDFGKTVIELLKQAFPNLRVEAAPEYTTGSGELLQLILPEVDGVRTAYPAYTEKLRAHALVTEASSWSQKNSGGTWGTVIRRPIAIKQMLGI